MAAQEVSGVMVEAMLQQQGEMREVSTWELEVEGAMQNGEEGGRGGVPHITSFRSETYNQKQL